MKKKIYVNDQEVELDIAYEKGLYSVSDKDNNIVVTSTDIDGSIEYLKGLFDLVISTQPHGEIS